MKHVLVVTIMLTVAKCFHEGRRIKYTQPNTETVVEINWLVYLQLISLSVSPGRSLLLSKN